MAGGGPHDERRPGRFVLSRPARLTDEDYRRYGNKGRWFTFGTRHFEPSLFYEVDSEVQRILGALMILNRTGLYSASFRYNSMLGILEIEIFAGPQQLRSQPVYRVGIDCRYDPLCNDETGETFSGKRFIEWLSLLVQ